MIGIVDYGMGNLYSVFHALEMVGGNPQICSTPEELRTAERIVLPGQGAFKDCIGNLTAAGFVPLLEQMALAGRTPLFGICMGMQVMAAASYEGGFHRGLGWFDVEVERLQPADANLRVPQIGWNDVCYRSASPLFAGLPSNPDFYFLHSYYIAADGLAEVDATCEYGGISVAAAIRKGHLFATQFHPEKSQDYGLQLLKSFVDWHP